MVPDGGPPEPFRLWLREAARPVENSLRQRELPAYNNEQARYGCRRHRNVACASWISGPQPCRENAGAAAQTPPRVGPGRSQTQKTSHRDALKARIRSVLASPRAHVLAGRIAAGFRRAYEENLAKNGGMARS